MKIRTTIVSHLAAILISAPSLWAQVYVEQPFDGSFLPSLAQDSLIGPDGNHWVAGYDLDPNDADIAILEYGFRRADRTTVTGVIASARRRVEMGFALKEQVALASGGGKIWAVFTSIENNVVPGPVSRLYLKQIYPQSLPAEPVPVPREEGDPPVANIDFEVATSVDGGLWIATGYAGKVRITRTRDGSTFETAEIVNLNSGLESIDSLSVSISSGQLGVFVGRNELLPSGSYRSTLEFSQATLSGAPDQLTFSPAALVSVNESNRADLVAVSIDSASSPTGIRPVAVYHDSVEDSIKLAYYDISNGWQTRSIASYTGFRQDPSAIAYSKRDGYSIVWTDSDGRMSLASTSSPESSPFPTILRESDSSRVTTVGVATDGLGNIYTSGSAVPAMFSHWPADVEDLDCDGFTLIEEEALQGRLAMGDARNLPQVEIVKEGGQEYLALTYVHRSGGVAVDANIHEDDEIRVRYTVEHSADNQSWSKDPTDFIGDIKFDSFGTTVARVRLAEPISTAGGSRFLRLRLQRY